MSVKTKRTAREQRVFVTPDLKEGAELTCDTAQRNYLLNVLRLKSGDTILLFNGRDGEWRGAVASASRKVCQLSVTEQTRKQSTGPEITLLFAPLKRGRLDYLVQKATELGAAAIRPVFTAFTQADRVNEDRMCSNVIEAAEQCGVLRVPEVLAPQKLDAVLDRWPANHPLIFCDEAADIGNPLDALADIALPASVLIGPEGGFSESERERLRAMPSTTAVSLGPRIMRADTAAVAALTLVNAVAGDWRGNSNDS